MSPEEAPSIQGWNLVWIQWSQPTVENRVNPFWFLHRLLLYVCNRLGYLHNFCFRSYTFLNSCVTQWCHPYLRSSWKPDLNKTFACLFTLIKGCLCMCQLWICTRIWVNVLIFVELGMCASAPPLAFHCTFSRWYIIFWEGKKKTNKKQIQRHCTKVRLLGMLNQFRYPEKCSWAECVNLIAWSISCRYYLQLKVFF